MTAKGYQIRKEFDKLKDLKERSRKARVKAWIALEKVYETLRRSKTGQMAYDPGEEYTIISGGRNGLKVISLNKEVKGMSFRLKIDVSDYSEEDVSIDTEDNRMVIKGVKGPRRMTKTLTIIAPTPKDMDQMVLHTPSKGCLVLEAL